MKRLFTRFSPALLLFFTPFLAFAQMDTMGGSCTNGTAQGLFCYGLEILNGYVVPILFAVAFVVFLFNVYKYFIAGGASEEKVSEGTRFVMWSIAGFVLMLSLWGIINIFVNTLGFNSSAMPALPTFNGSTNTSNGTGSNYGSGYDSGNTGSLLGGSLDPNGTTVVNGATMSNTLPAAGGLCPSGYTLSGSTCYLNPSYNAGTGSTGGTPANGSVANGGSCAGNESACSTGICNTTTNLCQAVPGDGTVPNGGSCLGNPSACSVGTCDEANTDTCIAIPTDGAVGQGGSCLGNQNACADGLTCADNSDTCQPDNGTNYDDTSSNTSGSTQQFTTCSDGTTTTGSCTYCNSGISTSQAGNCVENGGYE